MLETAVHVQVLRLNFCGEGIHFNSSWMANFRDHAKAKRCAISLDMEQMIDSKMIQKKLNAVWYLLTWTGDWLRNADTREVETAAADPQVPDRWYGSWDRWDSKASFSTTEGDSSHAERHHIMRNQTGAETSWQAQPTQELQSMAQGCFYFN